MPDPFISSLVCFCIAKLFYISYKIGKLEAKVNQIYNLINCNIRHGEGKRRKKNN